MLYTSSPWSPRSPRCGSYQPVLDNPAGYVAGAGHDNRIFLGAFLELLLIVANVGTAVVVYPLLKRVGEITLQQNPSAGNEAELGSIAYTLAAIKDWTFLLGPGFAVGIRNGLLLGYMMYRSELVPRRIAMLGLVGGPLVCITGVAVLFGVDEPSGLQGIATLPEAALWELLLRDLPDLSGA